MGAVKGHRRDAWWVAGACAVAALAYLPLASPYVQGGDVGEFATLFAKGGVAHPPGYPLFVLILRAFSWIPARSAAHGAALVTAAIQVGAVAMLARACRSWGASAQASALAALAYALSGSAWGLATHAEVFALNALLAAAIADASGPHARVTGGARVVMLGLFAGLGLSHHTTILAMGPIGLVGVVRGLRETGDRVRAGVYGVLALAAGLTPYAYTLWRSHDPASGWVWGDPMRFTDLVRHARRTEYWEIAASDGRGAASFGAHLRAFVEHLAQDLAWLLVPVALAGIVASFARARRDRRAPFDAIALVASFTLAGPVFLFLMSRGIGNVPMSVLGVSGRIVERFYLLPLLLACVPLALGFDAALGRVARARPAACGVAALAIVIAGIFIARPRVVEDGRSIVETYLVDTLQSLPPNAVLVGTGDHRTFGFAYAQNVLDVRRDVVWIDAHLVHADWYRSRVSRASPQPIPSEATRLVAHLASGERPLFLTNDVDLETRSTLPTYAIGTVIRVLPRASPALPDAAELEKMHEAFAQHLHRAPTPPRDRWGWAADADDAYARGWLDLAGRYRAEGDAERAKACIVRANARPSFTQ